MKIFSLLLIFLSLFLSKLAISQQFVRYVYYDSMEKNVKVRYQVSDTIESIANGGYTSYFPDGNVESKGHFINNKPVGDWLYFYNNGKLKTHSSPIADSAGYSMVIHYYKSGQKSMDGRAYKKNRKGIWKMYHEDGRLKSQVEYAEDENEYTEYYRSGKVKATGFRWRTKNTGYWKYFFEDGILYGEGGYKEGKKSELWKYYYSSGSLASLGPYKEGKQVGTWTYFFEDGKMSSRGGYIEGEKNGQWNMFDASGSIVSEGIFKQDEGKITEYYPSGKIKAMGNIRDKKKHGLWVYFYENGNKKGDCNFTQGNGIYSGYYLDNALHTKGRIENNDRIGLWEIYDQNGELTGYYKYFDENKELSIEEGEEISKNEPTTISVNTTKTPIRKKNNYFTPRLPEYRGIIIQSNPFFTLLGFLPISFEFYAQERLGYEFLFEMIRDSFFQNGPTIEHDKVFTRGYDVAIKQKFYNPLPFKVGMWYFGHEMLFTSVVHYVNIAIPQQPTLTAIERATELRAEYGALLGIRFMRNTGNNGFTVDAYTGFIIGYRNFVSMPMYKDVFSDLEQGPFSYTFRFGLNLGYSLSVSY